MDENDQQRGGRDSREGRRARRRADPSSTVGQKLRAVEARADYPPPEPVPNRFSTIERARGLLLGLAVGDSVESPLEFGPRIVSPIERREQTGGGPFDLPPGFWTDDSIMAVLLSESLVACQSFRADDVMRRYLSWFRTGKGSPTGTCFDIGVTTRRALERYETTGQPFQGPKDEDTSGNASLVRLAPLAIFTLDASEDEAVHLARESSRLTHGSEVCLDACSYMVRLLRLILRGETHPLVLALPRFEGHPAVLRAKQAIWGGTERRHIQSTGFVVDTLSAALWSTANAPSFEHAVTIAVNLGGDSDSVGCLSGAIAGARFGDRDIPKRWLDPLAQRYKLGALALSLVRSSSAVYRGGA